MGNAVIGAVVGAACSIASDIIAGDKIDWKGAAKEAAKGAVSALIPSHAVSSIFMIAVNTADYLWECKTQQKEVEGTVIVWEIIATVAGGMIGAGLEGGADVANKTVDRVVREATEFGMGTAGNVVGKKIKSDAEDQRKKSNSTNSKMPYLVCVWNASIGKYEERVVYP